MSVVLSVEPSRTRVLADPAEFEQLYDYLSCDRRVYVRRRGGLEAVDDRYHSLDRITKSFPSGLLAMAVAHLRSHGVEVTVQEQVPGTMLPPSPLSAPDRDALGWLRPYQVRAVEGLLSSCRGILKAATGAGKTEIIIALTLVNPVEWIVVCSSAHLVDQFAKRYLARTGERCGTYRSGRWARGSSNVTVATFQSISRNLKGSKKKPGSAQSFLNMFQGVAVDEVHEQPAKTFYAVVMAMGSARFRYGFSATPLNRSQYDTLRTVGAVGPILHSISAGELVAAGVLAQSRITMRRYHHAAVAHSTWREVYSQRIVNDAGRNALLAEMARDSAKPYLLFVDELQHAANLEAPLKAVGQRTITVDGDDFVSERRRYIREMVDGRYDGIVCTKIFQNGIDIPELVSVIVGCAKASAVAAVQRVGRGMRVADGKSRFEVWDVYDVGQHWLHKHSEARRAALEEEGHLVTVL